MTAQQKLTAKIANLNTAMLKDVAMKLATDTRDGSEIVFSMALDRLMAVMPETDFVAFCEKLEAA